MLRRQNRILLRSWGFFSDLPLRRSFSKGSQQDSFFVGLLGARPTKGLQSLLVQPPTWSSEGSSSRNQEYRGEASSMMVDHINRCSGTELTHSILRLKSPLSGSVWAICLKGPIVVYHLVQSPNCVLHVALEVDVLPCRSGGMQGTSGSVSDPSLGTAGKKRFFLAVGLPNL